MHKIKDISASPKLASNKAFLTLLKDIGYSSEISLIFIISPFPCKYFFASIIEFAVNIIYNILKKKSVRKVI